MIKQLRYSIQQANRICVIAIESLSYTKGERQSGKGVETRRNLRFAFQFPYRKFSFFSQICKIDVNNSIYAIGRKKLGESKKFADSIWWQKKKVFAVFDRFLRFSKTFTSCEIIIPRGCSFVGDLFILLVVATACWSIKYRAFGCLETLKKGIFLVGIKAEPFATLIDVSEEKLRSLMSSREFNALSESFWFCIIFQVIWVRSQSAYSMALSLASKIEICAHLIWRQKLFNCLYPYIRIESNSLYSTFRSRLFDQHNQ